MLAKQTESEHEHVYFSRRQSGPLSERDRMLPHLAEQPDIFEYRP